MKKCKKIKCKISVIPCSCKLLFNSGIESLSLISFALELLELSEKYYLYLLLPNIF